LSFKSLKFCSSRGVTFSIMQTVVCMHIYRLHNIHVNLQPSPLSILLQYCNILFWPIWLTHQISNLDLTFLPFVLIGLEQAFHLCNTSQLGSVAARDKIFWRVPIQTFYVTQTIFSSDQFRFWSLGYPGINGLGWRSHSCVKNLP